jgi:phosphatidylinositol alpha-1,6-mannosyltransferase
VTGPPRTAFRDRSLRIAVVTSELLPRFGGIETYVAGLVPELARDNVVGLIAEPGQWLPQAPDSVRPLLTIPLARVDSKAQAATTCRALGAAMRDFDPDIIHLASAGLAVYADALPPGVPRVVTVHGNDMTQPWQRVPGREPRAAILAGLQTCNLLIALSRHTASLAREIGATVPLVLAPPAADPDRFDPCLDGTGIRRQHLIPDEVPVVLTVGRLAPRKGHLFLLDALSRVGRPMHWLVAGDGRLRWELEAAVRSSPIADSCTIAGAVPDAELPAYYAASTLFAAAPEQRRTASGIDSEGFGLVYLEASAAARPIVTTATGGVAEAVIDGHTGILVHGRDADRFAAAVDRLIVDAGLARQLGDNGRRRALAGSNWRQAAEWLLGLYARLLEEISHAGTMA